MEKYFEPVLSEEQMAAYLDDMLSNEESLVIEDIVSSNPDLAEIQDSIDDIDLVYIEQGDVEIPIECLADDFHLPLLFETEFNKIGDESGVEDCIADAEEIEGGEDGSHELYFADESSDFEKENMPYYDECEDFSL